MKWGICPKCKKWKPLTKHSKTGHHLPPFILICRRCHDKVHGIKQTEKQKINKKFQKGTPKYKKWKK
jgi:hypothetical protein